MATIRVRDAFILARLQTECDRRHSSTLTSTAEQLLVERLFQVEAMQDKDVERAYGSKMELRRLLQEKEAEVNDRLKAKWEAEKAKFMAGNIPSQIKDLETKIEDLEDENNQLKAAAAGVD